MVKTCLVKNCRSTWTPSTQLSFHQFPVKNKRLLTEWMASAAHFRARPSSYSTLCSNHFSIDCFIQFVHKRSLKKNAVPTIFNNRLQDDDETHADDSHFLPKNENIKEEPNENGAQELHSDQSEYIKEEPIDIDDFKIINSQQTEFEEIGTQTDIKDTRGENIKMLSAKIMYLQLCFKRQQVQLCRIRKMLKKKKRRRQCYLYN